MVLHKDCAACFRRRNVFPKSGKDILEAEYSYYKIWDEIPPELINNFGEHLFPSSL
jgi:hypothetical protein